MTSFWGGTPHLKIMTSFFKKIAISRQRLVIKSSNWSPSTRKGRLPICFSYIICVHLPSKTTYWRKTEFWSFSPVFHLLFTKFFIRINSILVYLTLTLTMATTADHYFSQCYSVENTKKKLEQNLAKLHANTLASVYRHIFKPTVI